MKRHSIFVFILVIGLLSLPNVLMSQHKRDAFCKFTLGDDRSLYQKDLQKTQDEVEGVYYYRYNGILCQSYFNMEISYIELRFKDDKLVYIKTSSYFTSGQVEVFAKEARKEYGKPDAIQKERNTVISKSIWNGTNTWVSLTVNLFDNDSYLALLEVGYK